MKHQYRIGDHVVQVFVALCLVAALGVLIMAYRTVSLLHDRELRSLREQMSSLDSASVEEIFGDEPVSNLAASVYFASNTVPIEREFLSNLTIKPNTSERLTLTPGQVLDFTAVGTFASGDIPVNARWSLFDTPDERGWLESCSRTTTCAFTAGTSEGEGTVRVTVDGSKKVASVTVTVQNLRAAAPVETFKDQSEIPEWVTDALDALYRQGIVTGYDDGTFGAEDPLTRGQVVTLLYRALERLGVVREPQGCSQVYLDVPSEHYSFLPVCLFVQSGWFQSARRFKPDTFVSRGATASLYQRVLGKTLRETLKISEETSQIFPDVPPESSVFADVYFVHAAGIMTGQDTGEFGVHDSFNRAEATMVTYRIWQMLEKMGLKELQ